MMTGGKGSWGTWHTSMEVDMPCPQGCGRGHTVGEAVALNDKIREYNQAKMHARTKEWVMR
jgi:hypothetical protein